MTDNNENEKTPNEIRELNGLVSGVARDLQGIVPKFPKIPTPNTDAFKPAKYELARPYHLDLLEEILAELKEIKGLLRGES